MFCFHSFHRRSRNECPPSSVAGGPQGHETFLPLDLSRFRDNRLRHNALNLANADVYLLQPDSLSRQRPPGVEDPASIAMVPVVDIRAFHQNSRRRQGSSDGKDDIPFRVNILALPGI